MQQHPNQEKTARILLMVTLVPILPTFNLITKCHLQTIHTSERLWKAFSLPPLLVFRCPRNLMDFLLQETLTAKTYELPGIRHCGAARCITGAILVATDELTSHKARQVFKMKFAASCNSCNIAYLIFRSKCNQQYVGKTGRPLHCRITAIVLTSLKGGPKNPLCQNTSMAKDTHSRTRLSWR